MIDPSPVPSPSARRRLRAIVGLFLLGVSLVLSAIGLQQVQRTVSLEIVPADIQPLGGHAFYVELRERFGWPWQALGDNLFNLYRSDLILYEGGRPVGVGHAGEVAVRNTGLATYLHWGRVLIFSSTDNSDPRSNGRSYSLRTSAGIDRPLLTGVAKSGGVLVLIALGLLAGRQRARIAAAFGALAANLHRRAGDYATAALPPLLCTILAALLVPPLWNGSDSAIWFLWQLTATPHHPPLYPVFMAMMTGLLDTAPRVLHAVMIVQHTVFVLAVAYVASSYRERWKILLVSVLVCIGSGFAAYAHGLFTEGLANPFLLFFLGALLRLRRDGLTRRVAAALGLALLAVSLTRYIGLVFAALPVVYLGLAAAFSRWPRGSLKTIGLATALMAGAWTTNTLLTSTLALLLDAQTTSTLGRAGVYRLQNAYQLVPAVDAADWLAALAARAHDPAVREAIPLMVQAPNLWAGARDRIAATPSLAGYHPDVLLNGGFAAFAPWADPYVLAQWRDELARALFGPGSRDTCPGQISCLLMGSSGSIETVLPMDARSVEAVAGTGAEDRQSAGEYRRLAALPATWLMDALLPLAPGARAALLGGSLALALIALRRQRSASFSALVITLWAGIAGYALALTFITVVLPRYLSPIDILVWLSNAVCLVGSLERARSSGDSPALRGDDTSMRDERSPKARTDPFPTATAGEDGRSMRS